MPLADARGSVRSRDLSLDLQGVDFGRYESLKISAFVVCLAACRLLPAADPGQWPKWRGPEDNGMARTDAPLRWSDTENIKWKTAIPGRGHSSPVIWGDRIFV